MYKMIAYMKCFKEVVVLQCDIQYSILSISFFYRLYLLVLLPHILFDGLLGKCVHFATPAEGLDAIAAFIGQ